MDNRQNLAVLNKTARKFGYTGSVVELWKKEYAFNAQGEPDHDCNSEIANGMVLQEIWGVNDNEDEVREYVDREALEYRF